jgi:Tfp pilus assembly protein PilV
MVSNKIKPVFAYGFFRHREKALSGFSLVEVLLTLAMVALIVTPIMIQQGTLVRNADRISRRAMAVEQAQLFLYETQAQIQPGIMEHHAEKKVEGIYPMTLQFKRTQVSAKSDFGSFTNLVQDTVNVSWDENGSPLHEKIVTFRYQYPLQQEKKK